MLTLSDSWSVALLTFQSPSKLCDSSQYSSPLISSFQPNLFHNKWQNNKPCHLTTLPFCPGTWGECVTIQNWGRSEMTSCCSSLQKRTPFLRRPPSGCFLQENTCVGVFLILSIAKFLRATIVNKICARLPLKMCSWNWEKSKFIRSFSFTLKNRLLNINIRNKWKCLLLLCDWFPMKFVFTYNICLMGWELNFKH